MNMMEAVSGAVKVDTSRNAKVRPDTGLALSDETVGLIRAGVADNTLKAYRHATQKLEAWLNGRVLDDGLLATYITELHEQGKSPATVSLVVAAVKWQAKDLSVNGGLSLPITARTLAGIRRAGRDRGRGQVDGLTWQDVERVCAFAESTKTVAGLRDSAMIRLMSDCLLRISEAVSVNVGDLKKNTLVIQTSKTDQEGRGEALYVGSATLRIIQRYRSKANISRGALFRVVRYGNAVDSVRLGTNAARLAIKRWAAEAGVDGFISGHSLRIGSAVSLAQAGASVVDMQTAGRWKDAKMPAHYAAADLAERGAIARFKYNQ